MDTEQTLNKLLVQFFKYIMEIEERKLITDEFKEITYNDMHIIEAIGLKQPKKMSEIAKIMSVTTGTLTKAVNALEKKDLYSVNVVNRISGLYL
uniref:HTH marR-type domain-containing protein n=1 Tax=Eubacterium plexicaudatum ASF492 TaxID=1235802 RepID=N2A5N4_9FIRM